jgi:beta-N-acetylglucosaminidase
MKNLITKVAVSVIMCLSLIINVQARELPLTRGINSYSNATIEDIQKITAGTRLSGYEQVILDTEREYEVNAFFILAVAQAETGFGNAGVGRSRNNCFGTTDGHGYAYYSNTGESVKAFGSNIKRNYFDKGLYTLPKIGAKYCTSYGWAKTVENNINSIYNKMNK